ncbi:MAG: lysylphosphatidylglycerol synthase transmembrane domain-containing protein [Candidatus Omnitrophota bacterium]
MKSRLYAVLRVAISLVLLGLFFYTGKDAIRQGLGAIKGMNGAIIAYGCLITLLSSTLIALRFYIVLKAQGLTLRYTDALHLTLIGYFFNNFLPTAVGGDVVKIFYTHKKANDKVKSFTCVFMDRFIGLFSLFILAGISLIFCHNSITNRSIIWFTASILAAMLAIGVLIFNKRAAAPFTPLFRLKILSGIRENMEKLYTTINSYKEKKGSIVKAAITSIAAQLLAISVVYFFAKGLGAPVSVKIVYLFMPIVAIACLLPSIGGLGIRENAIYLLFGPYIGYENAFSLSLLWLLMVLVLGTAGGVSYIFRSWTYQNTHH